MTVIKTEEEILASEEHKARLLKELRDRVKPLLEKYPAYDSDFALLRWLQGRNYNIDEVESSLNWALHTMSILGVFDKEFLSIASVHDVLHTVSPLADFFPGGPIGLDKNGNIIVLNPIGRIRPRQLLESGRMSEFIIATVYECEGVQYILRAEEKRRGKKLGIVLINDLEDLSFDIISSFTALKIYFLILQTIQKLFADSAVRIYVINVPFALFAAWSIMEKVIAKETVKKIEILGTDFKSVLVNNHGADFLPPFYGGTMNFTWPRKGGDIPVSVRKQTGSTIKQIKDKMAKNVKKITVAARHEQRIPIKIEKSGSKLFWYFESQNDIEFCVECDNQEVWPRFRLSTEYVPEYNEIVCMKTGCYELVFSNKENLLWSKKVQYAYQLDSL